MTTQPELDFAHGLPSLVPTVTSEKRNELKLQLDASLQNHQAKTEIRSLEVGYRNRRSNARTNLHIWINHGDASKDNVLAQYASRHLDSRDDRMAEYKKQLPAIVKHLYANGMLGFTPTLDQLEKPTGFRWNQKAGCSCGCSPAFNTPSWLILSGGHNDISVNCYVKPNQEVAMAINTARFDSLAKDPTMPWASTSTVQAV